MQLKNDNWENLYVFAKKMAENRTSYEEIEKQLLQKESDQSLVTEIISQVKKTQYALARRYGLQKVAFGSLFLIVGFLITCFNFHSNQSFTIVMYSFTTIGLALIFWGLYEIIG